MDKTIFEKGREIRSGAGQGVRGRGVQGRRRLQHADAGAGHRAPLGRRDGLDHKTRSMLNLAMISCLNRPHEPRLHIAGALKNGVTRDEIREIFMQVAIYAGVPAGVDSFRAAKEVFEKIDEK